jgi:hypothetical protein
MIRKYKTHWGVIMPRGGGVKRFETEAAAKQFVLLCTLFEDVEWPSDVAEDRSYEAPTVTPVEDEEVTHATSGEDEEAHVSPAAVPEDYLL